MNFAEKLKQLRKQEGMSQAEVAKAIGVSQRAYQNYEIRGAYPRSREIYTKLAEVFKCDVNYLYTEDESFIDAAGAQYGSRGRKQAAELVSELTGLFAGGDIADEDMDEMLKALQDAYWQAKQNNRKFARKDSIAKEES